MNVLYFLLLISFVCLLLVFGEKGVDFSAEVYSESDFKCLKDDGYDFIIARAWHSTGSFDSNSVDNLKNAQSAGFAESDTDVYMFPCASSASSAKDQMKTMINDLSDKGAKYGKIWLDIEENEDSSCSWSKNSIDTNCDIIIALGNTSLEMGKKVGVYSNANEWSDYVFHGDKGACSQPARYGWELWYADYDDEENFDDFESFGGWTKPVMKQYKGTSTVCNMGVDLNWKS